MEMINYTMYKCSYCEELFMNTEDDIQIRHDELTGKNICNSCLQIFKQKI